MKATRKLSSLALALMLLLCSLAGCGGSPAETQQPDATQPAAGDTVPPSDGDAASTEVPLNEEMLTIGVIQIVEHEALNAAYNGFVTALADNGYVDGENITLDFQNAQGDTNNLSTISDRFVSRNVDMVLAIATPSAQAIAGKTTEIPILATAVTSYTAANLIASDDKPGGNISGTSDMNPVAAQIELIKELVPDAGTIGLIYNSSETNSVLQIDIAKEQIESLGLQWEEVTVTSTNEILQAMQSLAGRSDAVYVPTDNTIASAMPTVHGVSLESGIPVICGEESMVNNGGLATMGISYYDLGYKTGLMALDVLGGANPGDMPIQYADSSDVVLINGDVAEDIGFEVPEKYLESIVYPESN